MLILLVILFQPLLDFASARKDITISKKKANSFLGQKRSHDGLNKEIKSECCGRKLLGGQNVCSQAELKEIQGGYGTTKWIFNGQSYSHTEVLRGLCEVSIREDLSCKCKNNKEVLECGSDLIGTSDCKNPCNDKKVYCGHNRVCLDIKLKCNSNNDCGNWVDESGCTILQRFNSEAEIKEKTILKNMKSDEKRSFMGNVYILNRPVCQDNWSINSSYVLCKSKSFSTKTLALTHYDSFFGPNDKNYIMSEVSCEGYESTIAKCKHKTHNNCSENQAVGVTCIDPNEFVFPSDSEGQVYYFDLPIVFTENARKGEKVLCTHFLSEKFDGIRVPAFPHESYTNVNSQYCLYVNCKGDERFITNCRVSLQENCKNVQVASIKCAKCSPSYLINLTKEIEFNGTNDQLHSSIKAAIIKLKKDCRNWSDCDSQFPLYSEFCSVKKFLDEADHSLNTMQKGNSVFYLKPSSIGTMNNLLLLILKKEFNNLAERIESRLDSGFESVGNYFSKLANFNKEVSSADVDYSYSRWTKVNDELRDKQESIKKDLDDIFSAVNYAAVAETVQGFLTVLGRIGNIVVKGDIESVLGFIDEVDKFAVSALKDYELSKIKKTSDNLVRNASSITDGAEKNEKVFRQTYEFLMKSDLKQSEDVTTFLRYYSNYEPAINSSFASKYTTTLQNIVSSLCDGVVNQKTTAGVTAIMLSDAIAKCQEAPGNVGAIEALLSEMMERQTELMDCFAKVANYKIAENSAIGVKNSIKKFDESVDGHVNRLRAHYLIKSEKRFLIEKACTYLTYMKFGEEPAYCTTLMSNPNSDEKDLFDGLADTHSKGPCGNGKIYKSSYARIPAKFNATEPGIINIHSLYALNKANNTKGEATLNIPDKKWLLENKWIPKYAEGPFFLKHITIYLPPSFYHNHELSLKLDLNRFVLNGKTYAILNGTDFVNVYTIKPQSENINDNKDDKVNPYNIKVCNTDLGKIFVNTEGDIGGSILPSLEDSKWNLSLYSKFKLRVPYTADNFYLRADVQVCYKSINKKKAAKKAQKSRTKANVPHQHSKCCNNGSFYDVIEGICKQCPPDSNVRLGDYFCEKCPSGYTPDKDYPFGCKPCLAGTYKEKAGPEECIPCESGKQAPLDGSSKCL